MANLSKAIKKAVVKAPGSVFWIKKTITSSAITTAAQNLTSAATGQLAIEQVVVKTDTTGLAGGTNFVVSSSNAKGLVNIFVETVSNLGASVTKAANGGDSAGTTTADQTPTVTGCITILEAGQTLQFNNTGGAGTGAGTIDVFIKFSRVDENADVKPA